MDNCTVHMKGDSENLQNRLLEQLGILMIPLPPYWCKLNLTKLVFQTVTVRLNGERERYNGTFNDGFFTDFDGKLQCFNRCDVKKITSNVDTSIIVGLLLGDKKIILLFMIMLLYIK